MDDMDSMDRRAPGRSKARASGGAGDDPHPDLLGSPATGLQHELTSPPGLFIQSPSAKIRKGVRPI